MTNKQSVEGWRDRFTKLWYSLGDGEIEKMDDFIINLLEDIAVACEGEKKQEGNDLYDMPHNDVYFNIGLDTAANLIRSLKNHE